LFDDEEIAKIIITMQPHLIEFVSERLRTDPQFFGTNLLRMFKDANPEMLENVAYLTSVFRNSLDPDTCCQKLLEVHQTPEISSAAVKAIGAIWAADSRTVQSQVPIPENETLEEKKKRYIENAPNIRYYGDMKEPELLTDKNFILEMVRHGTRLGAFYDRCRDRDIVLAALQNDPMECNYMDHRFRSDREIVMIMVAGHGSLIANVADNLKTDPEIVASAIYTYRDIVNSVDDKILKNPLVVRAIYARDCMSV
jgi:hypothetical protein